MEAAGTPDGQLIEIDCWAESGQQEEANFHDPVEHQTKAEKTGAEKGTDTFSCFLCCQQPPKMFSEGKRKS